MMVDHSYGIGSPCHHPGGIPVCCMLWKLVETDDLAKACLFTTSSLKSLLPDFCRCNGSGIALHSPEKEAELWLQGQAEGSVLRESWPLVISHRLPLALSATPCTAVPGV